MQNKFKNEKLINISNLAKKLNLVNTKNSKPQTHTLRYWETKFSQIKPIYINSKQRLYSVKQVELIKMIKYLLKDEKLTIEGAKKILKKNINTLDDYAASSIKMNYLKKNLSIRSKNLLKRINDLKKHGKKNSYKS